MKNVHILPTHKPSRLCLDRREDLIFYPRAGFSIADGKQHIYITNDEEIKEGDWFYLPRTNSGYKCQEDPIELNLERRLGVAKIILTTDQDLIKDGVQAIDDEFEFEFLEWFVKNPSCENIEIEKTVRCTNCGHEYCDNLQCRGFKDIPYYKIIIPREEPNYMLKGGSDAAFPSSTTITFKPKQETLEEAANECALEESKFGLDKVRARINFIKGAKWQAERSQTVVPFDATEIEVFAIKPDDTGYLKAFIGYKVPNGNFMFSSVPFTEPQSERMYSEEEKETLYTEEQVREAYMYGKSMMSPQNFEKYLKSLKQYKKN